MSLNLAPIVITLNFDKLKLPLFKYTKLPVATCNQISLIATRLMLKELLEKKTVLTPDMITEVLPRLHRKTAKVMQMAGYTQVNTIVRDKDFISAIAELTSEINETIVNQVAENAHFIHATPPDESGWMYTIVDAEIVKALRYLVMCDKAEIIYTEKDFATLKMTFGYTPKERMDAINSLIGGQPTTFRKPTLWEKIGSLARGKKKEKPRSY